MSSKRSRPARSWAGFAVGLAIAAGVATLVSFWSRGSEDPRIEAEDASNGASPRVAWPIGERQLYRLRYSSEDRVLPFVDDGMAAAAAQPVRSSLRLDARVAVTGEGPGSTFGSSRVRFEVVSCDDATWRAADAEIWRDAADCRAMVMGAELGAEIDRSGRVLEVLDPPKASSAVQSLLQTLWLAMQVELPVDERERRGAGYRRESPTMHGTAGRHYVLRSAAPLVLDRRTEAYFDLRVAEGLAERPDVRASGRARFELDEGGVLRAIEGEEGLAVATVAGLEVLSSSASLELAWQGRESVADAKEAADWARRPANSILASARTEAQLLDQRVGGLDGPTLLARLRNPGTIGAGPDEARFLWQASGLLEQQPKLAWDLLPIAAGEDVATDQRARALDLLVSTGHDTAQAVLRKALGDAAMLLGSDVATRHLYQRLGMLERPNAETARMVADHYGALRAGGDRAAELTSAYSLGAIVDRLPVRAVFSPAGR